MLVQDYHFALLPRMIKQKRPDARVAIFWHIPWPNPEAFGICPWQRELVDGLLGADLIGFHIQAHCTNFLQTVDRIAGIAHRLGALRRAAAGPSHHWCGRSPSAWSLPVSQRTRLKLRASQPTRSERPC